MPLPSPQLDDLRYDSVVQSLMRRIPVYTPEWTDWNDSDPGITLIQLFAYLAEQVGYRLNQVPEKTYVELLKLLGVQLRSPTAATSRVGVFLAAPTTFAAYTLDAGSRFTGNTSTAVFYESDIDVDIAPAQTFTLLATKNPYLWDLLLEDAQGDRDPAPTASELPKQIPTSDCRWLTVVWDGAKPAGPDMPLQPVTLMPQSSSGVAHPYLWVGVTANVAPSAGFAGVAATLTIQFDDDEVPDPRADVECLPINAAGESQPPPIDWLAYFDASQNTMVQAPGRIDDSTNKLTRSGDISFTVPLQVGPIPTAMFANLRDAVTPTQVDACGELGDNLLAALKPTGSIDASALQTLVSNAVMASQAQTQQTVAAVAHPLDPALRDPTKVLCWLRIGPLDTNVVSPKLRFIGFNVVPVTNAVTVTSELVGFSNGRPGQTLQLAHGDVLVGSLQLGVQESADPNAVLTTWTVTPSLDAAGPNDRVFTLDAESGAITFGDGAHGRIPPFTVSGGAIIALTYRWGGGSAGNVSTGTIITSAVQFTGLSGVVNFVAAAGGRDAETLDDAKLRARKEFATRDRAVTIEDFEWIALRTPTVTVKRAIVIPRRRPLAAAGGRLQIDCPPGGFALGLGARNASSCAAPDVSQPSSSAVSLALANARFSTADLKLLAGSDCGPPLPAPPAGLDDQFEAPGVVTVVVVPDAPNPPVVDPTLVELTPTVSFMRAVCQQLDRHRLVTTEVYVAPPQYFRLCRVYCRVKAEIGYTRLQLRSLVMAALTTYLDVLQGGADGHGAPFGGQVHIADLMAVVLRTTGVARVEDLRAHFVRTKSDVADREGNLVLCPTGPGDFDHVDLAPEETTSLDLTSFTLDTA